MTRTVLNRRTGAGTVLVLVTIAVSAVAAPSLPGRVITQWSATGVPGDTTAKPVVLTGGPALVLGASVLG